MVGDRVPADRAQKFPSNVQELLILIKENLEALHGEEDRELIFPIDTPIAKAPGSPSPSHVRLRLCDDQHADRLLYLRDAIRNLPNLELETAKRLVRQGSKVKWISELQFFLREVQSVLSKTGASDAETKVLPQKRLTWFAFPFELRSAWFEPGPPGFHYDEEHKVKVYRLSDEEIRLLECEYPGYKPTRPPWELFEARLIARRVSQSKQPLKHCRANEVLKLICDFYSEMSFDSTVPNSKTTLAVDRFATVVKYRFRQITHAAQNDGYWPKHLGGADSRVKTLLKKWSDCDNDSESLLNLKKQAIAEVLEGDLDKEICPIIIRLAASLAERERVAKTVATNNHLPEELRPEIRTNNHLRWKVIEQDLLELESHFDWLEQALLNNRTKNRQKRASMNPTRRRKPAKGFDLVEQAVRNYHKFEGGNVDESVPPITGRELAKLAKGAFAASTADRWFRDRFKSKEAYMLACRDGTLGPRLALKIDDVRAFGTFDHSKHEIADGIDDLSDEVDEAPKKGGPKRASIRKAF